MLKLIKKDHPAAEAALEEFRANAKAKNTARTYDWVERDLHKWGKKNGVNTELPVDSHTVALWLAQSAVEGLSVSSLEVMRAAVNTLHIQSGFDPPCKAQKVREVLAGIRRAKGVTQTQKAPLVGEAIALMVRAIPEDDKNRARDRAILLLGFALGLRRSEIVGIQFNDCVFHEKGVRILLRKSKTDQEAKGHQFLLPYLKGDCCPVQALQEWARVRPAKERLFPFTGRTVANIVKRRARAVGIDPTTVSGHSLRAGYVTSAITRGKSEAAIQKTTRHRDPKTLRKYFRQAESLALGVDE